MTKQHPFKRLWYHAQHQRHIVIWATISSIFNKLFDLAPPALIGAAVDIVVQQENSFLAGFGYPEVRTQLWILAGITAFIWIGESILDYVSALLWRNLAQTIQHNLRLDAYGHVQGLELGYFEDQSTGGLMSVLNDDINQLERFLDYGAHYLVSLVVTVVVIGGVFIYLAPSVAWLAILPIPFIAWGSVYYQRLLEPRYAKVREKVGFLNGQLSNNLSGIVTIKSYTAEKFETERIRGLSQNYRLSNKEAIRFSAGFVPLIRMLILSGFIAIMVFGGDLALNGTLSLGIYSTMIFMTQRLLWPLTRLGETLDLYQRANASTARVMDLLAIKPGIVGGDALLKKMPANSQTHQGDIHFNNISFHYKSNKTVSVVKRFNAHIPVDTIAAFVGSTGAGKSTLVKLLLRFYDVIDGSITFDGTDVRDLRLTELRGAIGLVSQDVFLFHGTVRENICYGTFDAGIDEIIEAAKVAEAHDFIIRLPDGYDTIVGERGIKLSGGQRQRISIARAILKNPPVLILDEATSSVDNETEAAIQRSLEKIAVGRTTIIIAHRLSTVRNADQIFVLEHGKLKEQGKHEELVGNAGIYANLWRVQTGEMAVM